MKTQLLIAATIFALTTRVDADIHENAKTDFWQKEVKHHNSRQCSSNGVDMDSDNDGVQDKQDYCPHTPSEITVDIYGCDAALDSDDDGLSDAFELSYGTNPNNKDSDGDTLPDIDEIELYGTNPTFADSDSGGVNDDVELNKGTNPNAPDDDPVELPFVLQDGSGFDWTINNNAQLSRAESVLAINDKPFSTDEFAYDWRKRELRFTDTDLLENLKTVRRIFVPQTDAFVRVTDTFLNESSQPMNIQVRLTTRLSLRSRGVSLFTGPGANYDHEMTTPDPTSRPNFMGVPFTQSAIHWFEGEVATPPFYAQLDNPRGNASVVRWNLRLRPGETISLMYLTLRDENAELALERLNRILAEPSTLFSHINPVDLLSIANWFPATDTDNDGLSDGIEAVLGTDKMSSAKECKGRSDRKKVLLRFNPKLAKDSDRDGIKDYLDTCVISVDAPVDSDGCPITAAAGLEIIDSSLATSSFAAYVSENEYDFFVSIDQLTFSLAPPEGAEIRLDDNVGFSKRYFDDPTQLVVRTTLEDTETVQIPVFVELDDQRSNTILVQAQALASDKLTPIFIKDAQTIDYSDIHLDDVFNALAAAGDTGSGVDLFRQFWDSQRTESTIASTINCGAINGFALVCDREDSDVALLSDEALELEMERYSTLAFANYLHNLFIDGSENNWTDCGEHKILFGRNPANADDAQRTFFSVEAKIANPEPGNRFACEPIVQFWLYLPNLNFEERGKALRRFFFEGLEGFSPAISIEYFVEGRGQIRTNQLSNSEWMFREYEFSVDCDNECRTQARPVPMKENPIGALFDPNLSTSNAALSPLAADFQANFVGNIPDLAITRLFSPIRNPTDDIFNRGQSFSSGSHASDNDYLSQFGTDFSNPFAIELQTQLLLGGRGKTVSVSQFLNRATAMSCAGCHAPTVFGLTEPYATGGGIASNVYTDSWPASLGFVHIDEQRNTSPAMTDIFLPERKELFTNLLELFGYDFLF